MPSKHTSSGGLPVVKICVSRVSVEQGWATSIGKIPVHEKIEMTPLSSSGVTGKCRLNLLQTAQEETVSQALQHGSGLV